jgi:hypothetical protein
VALKSVLRHIAHTANAELRSALRIAQVLRNNPRQRFALPGIVALREDISRGSDRWRLRKQDEVVRFYDSKNGQVAESGHFLFSGMRQQSLQKRLKQLI